MSSVVPHCPGCGSTRIASRRQLFLSLMGEGAPPAAAFSWYRERTPGACPPQSRFVVLLALMLGMALPVTGLWLMGYYFALTWLGLLGLLLLASLLYDLTATYRRYRLWVGERVCGDCRCVFSGSRRKSYSLQWI